MYHEGLYSTLELKNNGHITLGTVASLFLELDNDNQVELDSFEDKIAAYHNFKIQLHEYSLFNIAELSYEQVRLVEKAIDILVSWFGDYEIHKNKYFTLLDTDIINSFVEMITNEVKTHENSPKFKAELGQAMIDKMFQIETTLDLFKQYSTKDYIPDMLQLETEVRNELLSHKKFCKDLEAFFKCEIFGYEYVHKGNINVFKLKFLSLISNLQTIQDSKTNFRKLDRMILVAENINDLYNKNKYENIINKQLDKIHEIEKVINNKKRTDEQNKYNRKLNARILELYEEKYKSIKRLTIKLKGKHKDAKSKYGFAIYEMLANDKLADYCIAECNGEFSICKFIKEENIYTDKLEFAVNNLAQTLKKNITRRNK